MNLEGRCRKSGANHTTRNEDTLQTSETLNEIFSLKSEVRLHLVLDVQERAFLIGFFSSFDQVHFVLT
jgi:hypothetical protein